jgi:hypothetical protein
MAAAWRGGKVLSSGDMEFARRHFGEFFKRAKPDGDARRLARNPSKKMSLRGGGMGNMIGGRRHHRKKW